METTNNKQMASFCSFVSHQMSLVLCFILPAFVSLIHLSLSHKLEKPSGWQVLDIKPPLCLILHSTTVLFYDVITLHPITSFSFRKLIFLPFTSSPTLFKHLVHCKFMHCFVLGSQNEALFVFFSSVNISNHKLHEKYRWKCDVFCCWPFSPH